MVIGDGGVLDVPADIDHLNKKLNFKFIDVNGLKIQWEGP
jgi:hypothetical protein